MNYENHSLFPSFTSFWMPTVLYTPFLFGGTFTERETAMMVGRRHDNATTFVTGRVRVLESQRCKRIGVETGRLNSKGASDGLFKILFECASRLMRIEFVTLGLFASSLFNIGYSSLMITLFNVSLRLGNFCDGIATEMRLF